MYKLYNIHVEPQQLGHTCIKTSQPPGTASYCQEVLARAERRVLALVEARSQHLCLLLGASDCAQPQLGRQRAQAEPTLHTCL